MPNVCRERDERVKAEMERVKSLTARFGYQPPYPVPMTLTQLTQMNDAYEHILATAPAGEMEE